MQNAKTTYPKRFGSIPGSTVSILSAPSKMPGFSWSLPAHKACPRANGDICDHCYAANGFYRMREVVNAQDTRFKWTVESMRTPEGRDRWIATMIEAISMAVSATGDPYFRIHDSGDMFNPHYAESWYHVMAALPWVRFWVPTRAWQAPRSILPMYDPLMGWLKHMAELPNCAVRPSALNFGDYAPEVAGLHAGTTVGNPDCLRVKQCPAKSQGNQCGECRVCWDEKDVPVGYVRH